MPVNNFKYIYALKDPLDGQIKYIGQTSNIKRRLFAHMAGQSGTTEKKRWILGLKMLGLQPEVILLESVTGCVIEREKYSDLPRQANISQPLDDTQGSRLYTCTQAGYRAGCICKLYSIAKCTHAPRFAPRSFLRHE